MFIVKNFNLSESKPIGNRYTINLHNIIDSFVITLKTYSPSYLQITCNKLNNIIKRNGAIKV